MANKNFKDLAFKIDNAAGSVTEITAWTNSNSISSAMQLLNQNGLTTEEDSFLPGTNGATISINGWINSTTEGIFGPLVGNRTSITKTAGMNNGNRWLTGEFWPNSVQFSGQGGALPTWSCDLTLEGALTRTATAPA